MRPVAVPEVYEIGDRVTHDGFGMGADVALDPRACVTVDFGSRIVQVPADGRLCKL